MFQWLSKALGTRPTPRKRARAVSLRLESLEDRCTPATLTVTDPADAGANTLRGRIAAATDGDTIVFANTIIGVGLLNEIVLNKSLVISGSGVGVSRDVGAMAGNIRLFSVSAGKTCTISGLVLTGGYVVADSGGAIVNDGTLHLESVEISGCEADAGGAIQNTEYATLTMTDCDIHYCSANAGTGGAIFNAGALTIGSSVIYTNSALNGYGGAIFNTVSGNVSLYNTDVFGNIASDGGGGISTAGTFAMEGGMIHGNSTDADAGGILIGSGGVATLTSVDMTENIAMGSGGGFYVEDGFLTIAGGTLDDNSCGADSDLDGGAVDTANGTLTINIPWGGVPDSWDFV